MLMNFAKKFFRSFLDKKNLLTTTNQSKPTAYTTSNHHHHSMIPGLEYETAPQGAGYADASYAPSSPSVHSMSSVDISPHNSNQQLHRRRPHSNANGYNGSNNSQNNSGGGNVDDDKYGKRSRAMRKLDIFPKTERDYTVRTNRGGQLTVMGQVLMAILVTAEWLAWRESNGQSVEHILVDKR